MLTESENDLQAEWLLNNFSNICASCKIEGKGCRKQAKAIACVACKNRKKDCSRLLEWRTYKEQHMRSASTTKTPAAKQTTSTAHRIILPPAKPQAAPKSPLVWTENMVPSITQPAPAFRGWAKAQQSLVNTAPTPPLTSPSSATQMLLDTTEDAKPDIAPRPKPTPPIIPLQLLPIPQPPPQRPSLGAPPQDTVQRLENQIRTLKRDVQDKDMAIDTFTAAKERLDIELRELRKTRLDEFLHISANRIKFQGLVNRFFARQLSATDFKKELQEHQHMLEELSARHLDQFPTDFEDGVDLLDNYRSDAGRRERDDDALLDSRGAKKLRTE